jgi:glutamine synthetase
MIRIPEPGRFELRLADGSANPYLLQAGILAAGLDGIIQQRNPGPRLDINMYTEGQKARGAKRLPLNLLDALRNFERSEMLKAALGAPLVSAYAKLKHNDWLEYTAELTPWERQATLDC